MNPSGWVIRRTITTPSGVELVVYWHGPDAQFGTTWSPNSDDAGIFPTRKAAEARWLVYPNLPRPKVLFEKIQLKG
ncbi:MAG: hypothetical protein H0U23_04710 [Blastocatellia bacterium]|nr:hypothetical protein [Blastocatellia bacterium]